MKILRYRTIAAIYPHLSFEVEALKNDGSHVFVNMDVNDKHELIDENAAHTPSIVVRLRRGICPDA